MGGTCTPNLHSSKGTLGKEVWAKACHLVAGGLSCRCPLPSRNGISEARCHRVPCPLQWQRARAVQEDVPPVPSPLLFLIQQRLGTLGSLMVPSVCDTQRRRREQEHGSGVTAQGTECNVSAAVEGPVQPVLLAAVSLPPRANQAFPTPSPGKLVGDPSFVGEGVSLAWVELRMEPGTVPPHVFLSWVHIKVLWLVPFHSHRMEGVCSLSGQP